VLPITPRVNHIAFSLKTAQKYKNFHFCMPSAEKFPDNSAFLDAF